MRGDPQTAPAVGPTRCPELGLERVTWVRIVVGPGGPQCVVAGVAHRRPVLRRIPARTAAALMAAGVPGVVRSATRERTELRPAARSLAGNRR